MGVAVFNFLRRMNVMLFVCMVALTALGVLFIYSACSVRADPVLQQLYINHLIIGLALLVPYGVAAVVDYRKVFQWCSGLFYVGVLILLVLVLVIGSERMGARRWLFGIQPSEVAKLAVIMVLAWLYTRFPRERGVRMFFVTLVLTGVPAMLILAQPDLGTTLVLAPTVFVMMVAAGVAPRWLWGGFILALLVAVYLLGAVMFAETREERTANERTELAMRLTCLHRHQVKRLQVFLFPDKELHGSGYNRRQSEIAVGSGGMWGKGYLRGDQYLLGYLPPSVSYTDFVFAVLAEEAGFAGSVLVLLLYLGLFLSGLWVALWCQDAQGRLFCIGVVTLLFSHTYINMAMTVGMMPITGLPLPFISYGRTFMVVVFIALGLVQSVSVHGREARTWF